VQNQVSPESPAIFELVLELHRSCNGDWPSLLDDNSDDRAEDRTMLDRFILYGALLLFNMGNYYGYGDAKFLPGVTAEFLDKIVAKSSAHARALLKECIDKMLAPTPRSLGFPDANKQSAYYEGPVSSDEVKEIDTLLGNMGIGTENTRICKSTVGPVGDDTHSEYRVIQASIAPVHSRKLDDTVSGFAVSLATGAYSDLLIRVCAPLLAAKAYASSQSQKCAIDSYIQHFKTGDIDHFKEAQKHWVKDRAPTVESLFGFVEQYRDPAGTRAEFEALVGLKDVAATEKFTRLVNQSHEFITELPWVTHGSGADRFGPFESARFEAPDFTSLHGMYKAHRLFEFANISESSGLLLHRHLPRNQSPQCEYCVLCHRLKADATTVRRHPRQPWIQEPSARKPQPSTQNQPGKPPQRSTAR
jgi:dipeptidyl-peptidase-3